MTSSFLPEVYQHLRHWEDTHIGGVKNGPIFRCSALNDIFRVALRLIENPDLRNWYDFEISWRHAAEETHTDEVVRFFESAAAHDISMFHVAVDYIEMAMDLSKAQIQMIRRIEALDESTFGCQTRGKLDLILKFIDE